MWMSVICPRKKGRKYSIRSNSEKEVHRTSLDILGKLCLHEMSSASVPRNIYFQVTSRCAGPVGVWYSLLKWRESRSLFPAVWQPKDCLIVPGRGPSNKVEESTCRGVFSNRQKSPGCKVWCSQPLSPGSMLWEDGSATQVILNSSSKAFTVLEQISFLQLWIKGGRSQGPQTPCNSLKRREFESQRGRSGM